MQRSPDALSVAVDLGVDRVKQVRRRTRATFVAWLATLLPGCTAPLVVRAGGHDFRAVPSGAQIVRTRTDDGLELVGLFVRGPDAAPVVLHLLPRGASATTGLLALGGLYETLSALREAGFASLAIDYRGVGASQGAPDVDALPTDAAAMWRLACELAGENGVVLRGASLGTLAAAALVGQGAMPIGIELVAPVDAATIVDNAARDRLGGLLGWIAAPFYAAPPVPSLREVLALVSVSTLVVLPAADPLFPPDEIAGLRDVVVDGVRWQQDADRDHEQLVLRWYGFDLGPSGGMVVHALTPEERAFLARMRASRAQSSAVSIDSR